MSPQPRQVVFKGRETVQALVFADDPAGRRRVLSLWSAGAELSRTSAGLLLKLARPRWLDCRAASGLPLVERDGALFGCPLEPGERKRLSVSKGATYLAAGGELRAVETLGSADASEWIDLSAFRTAEVRHLASPPPPIADVEPPAQLARRSSAAAAANQALVQALVSSGAVQLPWHRRVMSRLAQWLRGGDEPQAPQLPRPPARNPLQRLNRWLEDSRLSQWLARRHQDYLEKLIRMLDEQRDEALKQAVPLSREPPQLGGSQPLGLPARRGSLALRPLGPLSTGGAFAAQGDAWQRLQAKYRRAAEQLEAEGRYEEAAFVLAELLRAPLEAIAMLERHRQFALAAEFAEGSKLPPDLVVRLWFLAKKPDRAVRLARLTGTFAPAISRLEKDDREAADGLRLLWADSLALGADYASAVRVAWSVPSAQPLLLRWTDLGLQGDGPEAAELLARRLSLRPEEWELPVRRGLKLLEGTSADDAPARMALAEMLWQGTLDTRAARAVLIRAAIRSMLRDGLGHSAVYARLIAADEGALRVDSPPLRSLAAAPATEVPRRVPANRAALVPFDAVSLPGGRTLVALGDAGVCLLDPAGKVSWRGDVSAHRLCVDRQGLTAIGLSRREDVSVLSRISIAERRAQPWAELRLGPLADGFEDGVLFATQGDEIVALDTLADRPVCLWRVGPLGGAVLALACNSAQLSVLFQAGPQIARNVYRRPAFTFAQRFEALDQMYAETGGVTANGGWAVTGWNDEAGGPTIWFTLESSGRMVTATLPGPVAAPIAMSSFGVAVPVAMGEDTEVLVLGTPLRLRFEGARAVSVRWNGSTLTCAGDNGRILVIDLRREELLRMLSVEAGR